MSGEGPKLFMNKPKKAQLKQHQQQPAASPSPPSSMASQPSNPPPPPPPQPPKESFVRRYKYLWPLLLTVNFGVGAYLFARTRNKEVVVEGGEVIPDVPDATPVPSSASAVPVVNETTVSPPPAVKISEPLPEAQQRELFKWLLDEKRKMKPKNAEEKKMIDEEKAILKQFIRAKTIPSL